MAVSSAEIHERAGITLKIVVVGGNIAGLAVAYALKRAGHDIVVIEKSDGKYKSHGGLQSPPNMTKILYRWGLGPLLERLTHKCALMVFRNGGTNDMLGDIKTDKDFLEDLLAEFLFVQHQELQDMLYSLASEEGIPISFGAMVTDVQRSPENARVILDNGQTLTADFVIAADGFNSFLRPIVTRVPDEQAKTPSEKHLHMTFLLPVELLNEDDDLKSLMKMTTWPLWPGSGYIIHMNLTTGGKFITGTLTYTWEREILPEDEVWTERPIEYYQLDMDRFEPRLRKVIELVKTVSARIVMTRPVPEDLVCDQSKIVLIGEAAHPLLPGGNHCTALTIEDAETLRCLFSRIQHRDQISQFLTAYEEIRQPRCAFAIEYDSGFHKMMRCPAGPEQVARDEVLRQAMIHGDWDMDETSFRAVWGDELTMYAYDATEQVDDWWTQWGSLMTRKDHKPQDESTPTGTVTPVPSIPGLHRVSYQSPAHDTDHAEFQ
ncbi:hypothetical protein BDZ97DRAFT_755760 [Flammula alnicola]|nr:hypothetical protein BDZ97DRAFT_755760 [Flammula alnicola]